MLLIRRKRRLVSSGASRRMARTVVESESGSETGRDDGTSQHLMMSNLTVHDTAAQLG